jgi:putative ABC transport system permease protein
MRFALRQFAKSPGFAITAILTLAIGIGANTAIFSVVNAMLLNPLPYPAADRIVQVDEAPPGGTNGSSGGVFLDWYDNNQHFDKLAAAHPVKKNATGLGDPIQVTGWEVTDEFLAVLGIQTALGRDFVPADDAAGGNHNVAIVTHEFWQSHVQAAPTVVGQSLHLDGSAYEIIGVLPPVALLDPSVQYLSPTGIRSAAYKQDRNYSYVTNVIGRLRSGSTAQQAAAQLTAVKQGINHLYPAFKADWTVSVRSLQESMFGNSRPALLTLLTAVGAVLLIACVNVANLLLARTTARQGEIAVRLALGASRGHIVRQFLTESLLLAAIGGIAGLWLGSVAIRPLVIFAGIDRVQRLEVGLNPTVLAFALGASVLTGLLFGLLPALHASRADMNDQLKDGMRGSTGGKHRRVQSMLIVAETALTVVLLVSAGLLLRSFMRVAQVDPGFVRAGTLTFTVAQSGATATTVQRRTQFTDAILRELRAIPGVIEAGMSSSLPMHGEGLNFGDRIHRADRPDTAGKQGAGFDGVSADYLQTIGIPLLRGRLLTEGDNRPDAPKVMVVSSVFADQFFDEGEDPIGAQMFFKGEAWEIVGVVGSIRRFAMEGRPVSQVYFAQVHFPWYTQYVVQASVPPLSLIPQVRRAVQNVDPGQPIANISTLEDYARRSMRGRTIMLTLLGLFAGVALLLACIGIYGVMAYSVGQRRREMGIRIAVGAATRDVMRLVLGDGLKLVVLGLVLGAIGAGLASEILASQLYEVGRLDPAVFIGVALVLLLTGALACFLPARRATRVNPTEVLRAE